MNTIRFVAPGSDLSFSPSPGYREPDLVKRAEHRSINGTDYVYNFYHKKAWSVPLDPISKVEADTLNSWWHTPPQYIQFYPDLVNAPATWHFVRIVNTEAPIQEFRLSYWNDKFRGTLDLEEV